MATPERPRVFDITFTTLVLSGDSRFSRDCIITNMSSIPKKRINKLYMHSYKLTFTLIGSTVSTYVLKELYIIDIFPWPKENVSGHVH